MRGHTIFNWVFTILASLVLLFIIAPLAGMFLDSSFGELSSTVSDPVVRRSVWYTLAIAFSATLLFAVGAVPLAWIMARRKFPLKKVVQGIIDLPVVLPHTAAGIALLGFISREGLLGGAAQKAGILLVNNGAGIALAMAFVSLPFLINAARDGFAAVPERTEKAALMLGASQSRIFFTVSLPQAWRSVVSGFIMMFARGMSEFGAVVIIAYHPMIAPVLIYDRFNTYGLSEARPASIIFILVALFFFVLFRVLATERREIFRREDDAAD
ncbi:MAG: ABC transporter permease [Bacteroidales bacterium]|jgi:molybdate/tungstate transport system permease protein|nr:ABC transporter permease [Bacteroidales bacterium]